MRQHSHGVGAGAEERGMAERDDAGIAERQVEREREQDRHQQIGAEPEVVREREIEREREDPGQGLPDAHAVAADQRERGRMAAQVGGSWVVPAWS